MTIGEDTTIGPGVSCAARRASARAARSGRTRTLKDASVGDGATVLHSY